MGLFPIESRKYKGGRQKSGLAPEIGLEIDLESDLEIGSNIDSNIDWQVPDDAALAELSDAVGRALFAANATCATAESCTGGLIAKLLTDIAGSSAWFVGGFVCYSNQTKHSMLAVPAQIIEQYGAVSAEVVTALSTNVIAQTGVDIAVAVSGVAGPGGGSTHKPVGTVWIGWATTGKKGADAYHASSHFLFSGDRDQIRRAAAGRALHGILEIQKRG